MNKLYFYICFLLIILNVVCVKGQQQNLYVAQNILAKSLLLKYYGIVTNDPCSHTSYFSCTPSYQDEGYYYIGSLHFNNNGQTSYPSIFTEDITVFGNISSITIIGLFTITQDFYLNMYKLVPNGRQIDIRIETQDFNIPTTTVFPLNTRLTISEYGGTVSTSLFTSSNLSGLFISRARSGYSIFNTFPISTSINQLQLPISPIAQLPLNGQNLPNLWYLYLFIDYAGPGVTPFPNRYTEFPNLTFVGLQSHWSTTFNIPSTIYTLKKLQNFYVIGNFLSLAPNQNVLDFSFTNGPIDLSLQSCSLLVSKCTQKPCIVVNKNSGILLNELDVTLDNIDFKNITRIQIFNHKIAPLPIGNFEYKNIQYFYLQSNQFIGSIPEQYCQMKTNQFKLGGNQLTSVPSCFKCIGGNVLATSVFPNPFVDFTINSQPSCNTFWIDPTYNKIAFTDKPTTVIVKGKDLGYTITNVSVSPVAQFVTPNVEFKVTIPRGQGHSISHVYFFQNSLTIPFNFLYSYEKPTVNWFLFENGQLTLKGTGFSYEIDMNVYIIGPSGTAVNFVVPKTINGVITISNINLLDSIDSFKFYIIVAGQSSVTYTYNKQFSRNTNLFTIGGTVFLDFGEGVLPSGDNFNILIDGQVIDLIDVDYERFVNIGYYEVFNGPGLYSLSVQYSNGIFVYHSQIKFITLIPITIKSYIVTSTTNNLQITCTGITSSTVSSDIKIEINGIKYTNAVIQSKSSSDSSTTISFNSLSTLGSLNSFSFRALTSYSYSSYLTYQKQTISINPIPYTAQVNVRGGTLLINGNFGTNININYFTVQINNIQCDFQLLSATSINVNYPALLQFDNYPLDVISSGNKATTTIYYNYDGPPSQEF